MQHSKPILPSCLNIFFVQFFAILRYLDFFKSKITFLFLLKEFLWLHNDYEITFRIRICCQRAAKSSTNRCNRHYCKKIFICGFNLRPRSNHIEKVRGKSFPKHRQETYQKPILKTLLLWRKMKFEGLPKTILKKNLKTKNAYSNNFHASDDMNFGRYPI